MRDLATGEEHQVTGNDREPVLPMFSPDGRSILYTTNHQAGGTDIWTQIETVPADDPAATPTVLRPAADHGGGSQASYSPDGSRIVYFCGGLCTMAADGSDVQTVFSPPEGVVPVQPSWGIVPEPAG
jgi:Tol biopolymer transport system component